MQTWFSRRESNQSTFAYTPEDRRHHLTLIQTALSRMASSSVSAKSWLLPVVTAAYGFAIVQGNGWVALLGIVAVLLFAVMDAGYLRLERAFRALYRDVAAGRRRDYDMNPRRYLDKINADEDDQREENCRWGKVIWSWSLAGFYGPLIALGFLIATFEAIPHVNVLLHAICECR